MSSETTLVYYYIPDDYDSATEPNCFAIGKKKDEINLADIRRNFPIRGNYQFRFKYRYVSTMVWCDLTAEDAKVPTFEDKIICKASRLGWGQPPERRQPAAQPQSLQVPRAPVPKPPPVQEPEMNLNIFDSPGQVNKSPQQVDLFETPNEINILNLDI